MRQSSKTWATGYLSTPYLLASPVPTKTTSIESATLVLHSGTGRQGAIVATLIGVPVFLLVELFDFCNKKSEESAQQCIHHNRRNHPSNMHLIKPSWLSHSGENCIATL